MTSRAISVQSGMNPAAGSLVIRKPKTPRVWSLSRLPSPAEKPLLWLAALVMSWALWELITRVFVNNALLLPTPETTVRAAWSMYVTDRSIYPHLLSSAKEAGIGFALALIGIPLGLLIGSSRRMTMMLEPLNAAMYSLPHIALVPVAIVWFGLSIWSKVFIVFISTFFLILINTEDGVATVDRELSDVTKAFGSSRAHRFFTLTVPGTVPFIIGGIKLAVGRALVGVVAAELFAANQGLGYLLSIYGDTFQTARLFVVIATFAVAGGALTVLVGAVGRIFDRWRIE